MQRIRIKTVLAEIDQLAAQGEGRTFSLDYVKRDGKLGRKVRLVKGGASGGSTHQGGGALRYQLNKTGLLLVQDQASGEMRSLKIRRLTHYNNVRIQHG